MYYATLTAILVAVGAFLGLWWIWIPFFIWYGLYHNSWWLVIILILVDGYYGAFSSVPMYTILAISLFVVLEVVRPYILIKKHGPIF